MLKTNSCGHLKRFPCWLRQRVRPDKEIEELKTLLDSLRINTVCRSARCPNIYDCFSRKKCTFLILGNSCTRNCGFCAIELCNDPQPPDKRELFDIKEAVSRLGARNIVITSVTRDDLSDGGAGHFADCVEILRDKAFALNIELLVPDFLGRKDSIEKVISSGPDVFAHNIETVPRLYDRVRPGADYKRSLGVLKLAKESAPHLLTKSGIMVGIGEERKEIYETMNALRDVDCDILTIGQYLKPDSGCLDVEEFLRPGEFDKFSKWAEEMGFKKFSCSPFTRSSSLE
ncbi:MAG: lipoyl synthase [Candidatus Omnitrophica bacterium]|nr:lipoyl synthase [Candidatus Omnitrophota bacterium]